jgi:cytochrome c oxidase subunit 1
MFLGALGTDVHLHDTYFVVAHFHYVMMGGTAIAFFGGLHHWWPKMFGRCTTRSWPRSACGSSSSASTLTFFTQFILGTRGMPRRYATYVPEFRRLHPRRGFTIMTM